jgi:hypothetical protein
VESALFSGLPHFLTANRIHFAEKCSNRLKALCILVPILALGGCVDYLKRRDTVTLEAGDAQAWNKVIHTADPWPPYVADTQIGGDGQRTARVMQRYSTGSGAAGSQAAQEPASANQAGSSGAASQPPQ